MSFSLKQQEAEAEQGYLHRLFVVCILKGKNNF
jgi:hypothetical protein